MISKKISYKPYAVFDMKKRHKRFKTKQSSSENDPYLIRIKKGERLYKFFYFRPMAV